MSIEQWIDTNFEHRHIAYFSVLAFVVGMFLIRFSLVCRHDPSAMFC